jgi:hypothetical protein
VNEERECTRLWCHSASHEKFAALALPHAHAAGAAPAMHTHRWYAAPHANAPEDRLIYNQAKICKRNETRKYVLFSLSESSLTI